MPQLTTYYYVNQYMFTITTLGFIIFISSRIIMPAIIERYMIRYIFIILLIFIFIIFICCVMLSYSRFIIIFNIF